MEKITEVTFNDIVDIIENGFTIIREGDFLGYHPGFGNVPVKEKDYNERIRLTFYGKLDEISFLKRLYDLENLPSLDIRYKNAEGDIWQHTINNDDFEPFWFFEYSPFDFKSNDGKILNFICEMFHPAVRKESEPWKDNCYGICKKTG